ncbi:MAG TPA: Holliday junction resolvase RecU [Firmicutes bacterium]|nr:Holliday junction resolvase RecU [Bacillota bacterium]
MIKGRYLETQVEKVIAYLKTMGYWGQKNYPYRTDSGIYIDGEPFDYYIITNKVKLAFDAKECNSARWQIREKDIKQANNLVKLSRCGFDAFFLVYFVHEDKVIKFDIATVMQTLSQGRKNMKSNEGKEYRFEDILK